MNSGFTGHLFGLPQKDQRVFNAEDEYEQKFPEDPTFRETEDNARVWRTYLAESAIFDENMVGEARDGLDSMLVFAGLFSAVITSFLIEAAQNLQADYTQLSATLLYELVSNSSGSGLSPPNPASEFVPDARDVWINVLWAISLTFSLVVALASVLIKQWLRRYLAFRSGTPAERSHLRQYRFIGFETWQVPTIVGSLPVIMHLSLALFLIGLVLFFIPLHFALSCVIGGITLAVYMLYFASNILPIFFPHCPYRTPFSAFFLFLGRFVRRSVALGSLRIKSVFVSLNAHSDRRDPNHLLSSLDDLERSAVDAAIEKEEDPFYPLSVHALHWLFSTSTNLSVHSIVFQAIGGLPALEKVRQAVQSLFNYRRDCEPTLWYLVSSCITWPASGSHQPIHHLESVLERLCRTLLFFPISASDRLGYHMRVEYGSLPDDPDSLVRKGTFLTLQDPDMYRRDYLDFIMDNRSTKHHFFVWEALLKNAFALEYTQGDVDNAPCEYSTPAILSYFDDLIWQDQDSKLFDPSLNDAMSFTDAITHLPKSTPLIQSWMLRMLARHDLHPTLPPSNRIIEAMLQFLLYHVWDDLSEDEFWKYLNHVFVRSDIIEADRIFHEDESCDFSISSFIVNLCKKWMSRPEYQPSALDQLLVEKVKIHWEEKLAGPSIKRVMALLMTHQTLLPMGCRIALGQFGVLVIDLLRALRHGSVEAHCSFIDDNYLMLLYEHYKNHPQADHTPILVSTFVLTLGLQDIESPERARCIDYLFEPKNSRYAIILLILESDGDFMPAQQVQSGFAKLCPQRQLLIDLRGWMNLLAEYLDVIHEEDRGRLKEKIGMDPLLSDDEHSMVVYLIKLFDDYLAETQEGTVVQGRARTTENSRIVLAGSSALQSLEDVADTQNVQPSSPPRTSATLLWRKVRDAVQGIGKQNLSEGGPPNFESLSV
ncbi:hypothetical protein D9757_012798 [Collybiopsis confluens]|uniref:DUF6535 domain-containing protein n=1 Tax=Collybiopsis confluens TaxID=2823264 RepID=A0A8H5GJ33_9AGAR|nr:hypothetical protein D9757_012798 [Collybiopsis confluens]